MLRLHRHPARSVAVVSAPVLSGPLLWFAVLCCAVGGYSLLQKRLRQVSIPYPVAVAVESRRALGEASEISVSLCW